MFLVLLDYCLLRQSGLLQRIEDYFFVCVSSRTDQRRAEPSVRRILFYLPGTGSVSVKKTETVHQELFSRKFLILLLAISILTNCILLVRLKNPNVLNSIQIALTPAPQVVPTDHVRGNANAKYTVIEYADFQCPFCTQFHETMKTVMNEADVRWVFRQFPIKSHPLAEKAAEASECAGAQGKFWEYSDALFGLKGPMTEGTFLRIAQDLGLDWISFSVCLNTGKYGNAVAAQQADGVKNKINVTPTFYLNGKRVEGFVTVEELRKMMGVNTGK
jgi:predicted DsbA family dithiol-disulfide isomerase